MGHIAVNAKGLSYPFNRTIIHIVFLLKKRKCHQLAYWTANKTSKTIRPIELHVVCEQFILKIALRLCQNLFFSLQFEWQSHLFNFRYDSIEAHLSFDGIICPIQVWGNQLHFVSSTKDGVTWTGNISLSSHCMPVSNTILIFLIKFFKNKCCSSPYLQFQAIFAWN